MQEKAIVMDEASVVRALRRMALEIIEQNKGTEGMVFVGIKRRGVSLAKMLAAYINETESVSIPVGELDITLYRDDLPKRQSDPNVAGSEIPFDITNKHVILVDDVLYTGRTIRAAMDALMDIGRPKHIRLVVLIDRGHREYPIQADIVGRAVPTSQSEVIGVRVLAYDACLDAILYESNPERFNNAGDAQIV